MSKHIEALGLFQASQLFCLSQREDTLVKRKCTAGSGIPASFGIFWDGV